MHTLRRGNWYLMYVCNGCQKRQVLFPDSQTASPRSRQPTPLTVPSGHKGSYDSDHIELYQHLAEARAAAA